MAYRQLSTEEERIATIIVDAAVTVHKALGPGLLENVYEVCLHHELGKRGLRCQRQVALPIVYDDITFEEALRLDLLVEDSVICELKATDEMHPVYMAQILSHLRLAKKRLGFLINFNVPLMKNGIRRVVI
ncbi:MAG TPA: GxxExxY protein [Kouleothrix sp.]|uniref:GxxExxY protein n=1 Tax=Kouleothrix sp. TaxID=2779161 RepID=UPI002CBF49E8|nr:GxxExxY protein [Kouleothrix sp.]